MVVTLLICVGLLLGNKSSPFFSHPPPSLLPLGTVEISKQETASKLFIILSVSFSSSFFSFAL